MQFWLGAGNDYIWYISNFLGKYTTANSSFNLADSTSNEWYITGVQLEAGTSASDFEFLPHDVNLKRTCLRYYEKFVKCSMLKYSSNQSVFVQQSLLSFLDYQM